MGDEVSSHDCLLVSTGRERWRLPAPSFHPSHPKMGWSPTVLSADLAPHSWSRYDPELLRMVPPETEVVSVRSTDWWQAIQARRTARIQRNEGGYSSSLVNGLFKTNHHPMVQARHSVRIAEAWCYHPDTRWAGLFPVTKPASSSVLGRMLTLSGLPPDQYPHLSSLKSCLIKPVYLMCLIFALHGPLRSMSLRHVDPNGCGD